MLFNFINNNTFPNFCTLSRVQHFNPNLTHLDWAKLNQSYTPARALSEIFWLKINWPLLHSELGKINIFDVGCGGAFGPTLQDFSGNLINRYYGVDSTPRNNWKEIMKKHPFITLKHNKSHEIFPMIPKETNFFITQSAIEHFEDDLIFFKQILRFIKGTGNNILQIHLFPSPACLKLYRLHGVRQYTPRTVSKITNLFYSRSSYYVLYKLGGPHCNQTHFQYITKNLKMRKEDGRFKNPEKYEKSLLSAIKQDFQSPNGAPSFFALVIHSNYKNKIFDPPFIQN